MIVLALLLFAAIVGSSVAVIRGFADVNPPVAFLGVIGLALSLWAAFEMGS